MVSDQWHTAIVIVIAACYGHTSFYGGNNGNSRIEEYATELLEYI